MPPRFLIVESRAYIRSELLTQWTAGCKTLNNVHCDYTYYQGLLLVFFSFMVDYIKFRLALAIFFQGNFHTRGAKKLLYELNSSNIIRFKIFSLLL